MQGVPESRMIRDPFLVKEIVEFTYDRIYEKISKKKIVSKPSVRLGTAYDDGKNIVKHMDRQKDYLLIDGFIYLSKRAVPNKVYIMSYEELLKWIEQIDEYFEGLVNIIPIEKSNPDSYTKAVKIFHAIEEGVFFLVE